jgi:hypothetical protein
MIETSCWLASTINSDSEPTAPDTPLLQSLLDELGIVWRDRDRLDKDDTEDEMIARICRWRKPKHQQCVDERLRTSPLLGSDTGPEEPAQTAGSPVCSGQMNLLRASGSVMTPEEARQLQEKLSRGARRQPKMNPTAEDQAVWRGRLRPRTKTEVQTSWRRSDAVSASRDKTKATNIQTGKPQGIIKRRKAPKKRLVATKGQATTFTTTKADPSHPSTQSHFNESASQAVPDTVAKARGPPPPPPKLRGATARCAKGPQWK